MAVYFGQVVGALGVAAWPMDRFGPRPTLSVAVAAITGCISIQFFSQSIEVLYVGKLLQSLVSGSFIVFRVSYASELAPLPHARYPVLVRQPLFGDRSSVSHPICNAVVVMYPLFPLHLVHSRVAVLVGAQGGRGRRWRSSRGSPDTKTRSRTQGTTSK